MCECSALGSNSLESLDDDLPLTDDGTARLSCGSHLAVMMMMITIIIIVIAVIHRVRKKHPLLFSCILLEKVTNFDENFRQNS